MYKSCNILAQISPLMIQVIVEFAIEGIEW